MPRSLAYYYPRPETGLAKNYFCEQNVFLRAHGLKINAFIAGDKNLRYPLYQGLPTLEKQRYLDPLVAWVELKNLGVTGVYLVGSRPRSQYTGALKGIF